MYIPPYILFGVLALFSLIIAYGAGRLHQWAIHVDQTTKKGVPYFWRNFIEDTTVPNIRTRDSLEMLRLLVKQIEREIEDGVEELSIQSDLLAQYRNGTYDKDQPARQRKNNAK